ncbi:MAG TPA: AsnC family transcriptional regulator [Phycisphaerae bacterium]|nr:AsnC family transcriptional regulator [Phycisphaerae bacterium]
MDELDRQILTAIQAALPMDARPFDALAGRLGTDPEDVLRRVRHMLDGGLIRRLGPVFDSARLGYVSTLVAARVPADRLADVAERVGRLPGVTHCYERTNAYNLWFTLTAAAPGQLDQALERLRHDTGVAGFHSLPALAVYKIRVHFNLTDAPALNAAAPGPPREAVPLSDDEKRLVRLLQDGLPVAREPLAGVAEQMGWPEVRVVDQVRAWLATGVIRRFGAVVRHQALGFAANGMAVFHVPAETVDAAGRQLAAYPQVSHCYRRPPLPGFPYNLYAMVHGRSAAEVRCVVDGMARDAALPDYDLLFSTREFKKVSMRYFVHDEG